MATATTVPVEFDDNSLQILKGVDSIHRNSLINLGLALISKTGYYSTLSGKSPNELVDVVNLDNLLADADVKSAKTAEESNAVSAPKATVSWDDL